MRITEEVLRDLFSRMERGEGRIQAQHDARLPLHPRSIRRELRRTDDGELGIWFEMEVEEAEWERAGGDALRGFSVAVTTPLTRVDPTDERPQIRLAADAAHFDDEQIIAAAEAFGDQYAVAANELLQFSFVPPATVAVFFSAALLQDVAAGLTLAGALWSGLRRLLHPKQAERSIFVFDVEEPGRTIRARLETNSEDTLKNAIDQLRELAAAQAQTFDFDEEAGEWKGYL